MAHCMYDKFSKVIPFRLTVTVIIRTTSSLLCTLSSNVSVVTETRLIKELSERRQTTRIGVCNYNWVGTKFSHHFQD